MFEPSSSNDGSSMNPKSTIPAAVENVVDILRPGSQGGRLDPPGDPFKYQR